MRFHDPASAPLCYTYTQQQQPARSADKTMNLAALEKTKQKGGGKKMDLILLISHLSTERENLLMPCILKEVSKMKIYLTLAVAGFTCSSASAMVLPASHVTPPEVRERETLGPVPAGKCGFRSI
ncbi:hypothetical protein CB1_000803026 [Camelus ferus]|nr:hypothetical protein CB1_000803026 [Camelus ferus]